MQHYISSVFSGHNRRAHSTIMTSGSILRHIVVFSLPLMAGNLFQQLYNTVDTWVVGNFVSNEAFSAVGTVSPIINMLIGFFLGLSSGAGVVISQYYGAGDNEKVSKTVHTSLVMTFILCVVFTVVGIFITPLMLNLMKTPPEVYPESKAYLTIYFAGVTGLLIYNMGAAILRAIGDSRRPFLFLVVSALTNTGLDLLFVLKFKMGVKGVAYATIIAQGLSALLVIITLLFSDSSIRLRIKQLRINTEMLRKIIKVGIPAALQLAITAFSNVFVQSYINFFGADCMSGWTAYLKIDQFLFLPMQSVALAATTFVGQNLGKNQIQRAKKGVTVSLVFSMCITLVSMVPVLIFAKNLVGFFNSKPEVIEYGSMMLAYISPFYVLCCINQVYSSALRGAGNSRAPMIIMISSFVVFRQCYLFIMSNFISNTVLPIAFSYPAGWLVCSAATIIYYRHADFSKSRLVENNGGAN